MQNGEAESGGEGRIVRSSGLGVRSWELGVENLELGGKGEVERGE